LLSTPTFAAPLRVAAASDLAVAFKEVGAAFERERGDKVVFTFGSTGLLEKQLAEGAPFDVFAAANVSFVDDAVHAGVCLADSKTSYARGRIVVWWPKSSTVKPPKTLAELADARFVKIAIANPAHAPYGQAAAEALTKAGVFAQVKSRLVFGENVQQTLQFAQSGNAELALVAMSLATMAPDGEWLPIADADHAPIEQSLVVCGADRERVGRARAFAAYVGSPAGRAIMRHYGFLLPGETQTASAK
jgi:molybdate transport system substrate-binding protein